MAFREKGHSAFSCDITECSGGHPEWHIKGDVLNAINGDVDFETQDGNRHRQRGEWDLIKDGNYRRAQGRKERDPRIRAKTFWGIANAMAEQWG